MQIFLKIIDNFNKLVGLILALMLAVMSILILTQIFTRFVINYPLHWTEEVARYLMVYSVFLGAALALRQNKLIAIELLNQALGESKEKILKVIIMLISLVFFIILFFQGIEILGMVNVQTSAGLGISMAIPYAAIPVGAALMAINAIAVILETLLHFKKVESEGI
ncbi:TRAP transporter small permease [Planococcus sp. X10-3]|uniref:TRAP transporter small permease n=1 Tax=Planococcus sp. X10-3 TaxID=3061240 RepID=UPI003BAF0109